MKKIAGYLKDYAVWVDKPTLTASAFFLGLVVFLNYHFHLNQQIDRLNDLQQFAAWYFIFLAALLLPYGLHGFLKKVPLFRQRKFVLLLLLAPAIFAWKMSASFHFLLMPQAAENDYWNRVVSWPLKLLVVCLLLFIVRKLMQPQVHPYGLSTRKLSWLPYFLMLLLMLPLIAAAATQPDFLRVYPKFQEVPFLSQPQSTGWHRLVYELSYGSDFFTIELFFRGFLVLGFAKWAGRAAILPMAVFYCTIHFGKPLGECISSFFGGLLLGVVVYHTRSIYGGLLVHLGIAWLMELAGYMARLTPGS